jgi:cytochrome bd ubiquinol oxidase subunit I
MVMLATAAWHLRRGHEVDAFRRAAQASLVVLLPAITLQLVVGGRLGVNETTYQPMKIAGAEAQFQTCQPCSFSLFQIGGFEQGQSPTKVIQVPHLLSILATGTWNGKVQGLTPLNAQSQQQYGSGNYIPNSFVQYWSMRVMAYLGVLVLLLGLWAVFAMWRRKFERSKWLLRVATWAVILPFLINTAGWFLTENGRQPWIVQGLQKTADGVSASVSSTMIWISLLSFIAVFLVLLVVDLVLMLRYARRDLPAEEAPATPDEPALTY